MFLVLTIIAVGSSAHAAKKCNTGAPFNPITDVAWEGIFPIKLGGVSIGKGDTNLPDTADGVGSPVCICPDKKGKYVGLDASYWEPSYLAEVVKDAYCTPTLGTSFDTLDTGFSSGGMTRSVKNPRIFKQVHWVKYPVFELIGALTDMGCKLSGGIDYLGVPSELDPTYNDGFLATLSDPTAYLFAAPPFDLACVANAAIAQFPGATYVPGYDALFWCWWDNIYPMTGDRFSGNELESAATIAARQIFHYYKYAIMLDDLQNACKGVGPVLPKKSHWRFQTVKPVKGGTPFIPGASEFFWGINKNPAFKDGNFLFLLFKKKRCCEKIKGT